MKGRKAFLGAVLFMLSLILLGDWNPGKYVAKPNEEIYGTWVNKDNYGGVNSPQKEIITADGVKKYDKVSDPTPLQKYTKIIDSKWTDAEGNIWYKTYGTVTDGAYKGWTWQGIDKLSKGATVWELTITVWVLEQRLTPYIIRPKSIRLVKIIGWNTVRRNRYRLRWCLWLDFLFMQESFE